MKLTVLGRYGPYPPAGGATSGYLLEEGNTRLLVECGAGVLSRLQSIIPIQDVSGVILSHLHSDHMSDTLVLRYALEQLGAKGLARLPVKVMCPQTPRQDAAFLRGQSVYELICIMDGLRLRLGDFEVSFHAMRHPAETYGMHFYAGGKTLVYTGDTCLHDELLPFCMGADLLLADACLLEREKGSRPTHLTALEAGKIAANSGVGRLLLTHMHPLTAEQEVLEEAQRAFAGVEIAQEGVTYTL